MTPLYEMVATTMERLGIQPVSAEERTEERRVSRGRRFEDSGWQFLADHMILNALEVCLALLAYGFFFGGAQ